ncbi:MAG: YHS domain-containing protein [Xanthomonadales bacterium]|nr:YHS domain-containing protein [Xanthomonadales bacterium]
MKRASHEQTYKDPVCGMEVSYLSAADTSEYKGKTYYFCAHSCRQAFDAEPQQYLHQHRQHGMPPGNPA